MSFMPADLDLPEESLCPDEPNTEEYNQVDPCTLDCFPDHSYPVDLYRWRESAGTLSPIYRCGAEVHTRLRGILYALSEAGKLFFSRNQIRAYTECLSRNLDAALDDPNLTWNEKSHVLIESLGQRQQAMFQQPMPQELDNLDRIVETLCLYLIEDSTRMRRVVHHVHCMPLAARQRLNAALMALAIFLECEGEPVPLERMHPVGLGFFLFDIGMSRVSRMLSDKKSMQLVPSEQRRVQEHPLAGFEIAGRLNLVNPEIVEPIIQHHERLNGTGYPNRLRDRQIGKLGRIAGVADSYVAMITDRPHSPARPPLHAAAEIIKQDKVYDQSVARKLVRLLNAVPSVAS